MPIFGGGDGGQTTQTTRNVPEWVEQAGRELFGSAKKTTGKGHENRVYPGERLAPLNESQNRATNLQRETHGYFQPEAQAVTGMHQNIANTRATNVGAEANRQNISTNRFTGTAPDSLFSSYFQKMYQPQAAELNREAQRGMTQHTKQNLFGGKRFGSNFAQGQNQLEQGRLQQLQGLGSNIFDKAMNTFQTEEARMMEALKGQAAINDQDMNRKLQADLANQTAGLQDKALDIKNAEGMMNNILSKHNMNRQDIEALFNIGQGQQKQTQRELDAAREKWGELNNYDRIELEWLSNFLKQNSGGELKSTQNNPESSGTAQAFALGGSALPLIASSMK